MLWDGIVNGIILYNLLFIYSIEKYDRLLYLDLGPTILLISY